VDCLVDSFADYWGMMGMESPGSDTSVGTGAAGGMGLKTPARHTASLARLQMRLQGFSDSIMRASRSNHER
jgi:hypothetical protein